MQQSSQRTDRRPAWRPEVQGVCSCGDSRIHGVTAVRSQGKAKAFFGVFIHSRYAGICRSVSLGFLWFRRDPCSAL